MTKNRRYEAHYDALNDQRIAQSVAELMPTTLPLEAYGLDPIAWAQRSTMPPRLGMDLLAQCAGIEGGRGRGWME